MKIDVAAQVERARSGALIVPVEGAGILEVAGSDRASWLNGLVTCDVAKLRDRAAMYGLAVTQKGRVLADLDLVADGDRLLVVTPGVQMAALREELERYLVMEDVELTDATSAWRVFRAHGPLAASLVEAARGAGAVSAELDWTGLGGALVLAPAAREDEVRRALGDRGGDEVVFGDVEGWHALRLERAVPSWGDDFDLGTYPQEAGLEQRAVAFDKGCYLGQEVVCMLQMRGHVKRKLATIVLEASSVPARGEEVHDAQGVRVGEITSAAVSPTLNKPVALAMLKAAATSPGTRVRVGNDEGLVVERPA